MTDLCIALLSNSSTDFVGSGSFKDTLMRAFASFLVVIVPVVGKSAANGRTHALAIASRGLDSSLLHNKSLK